MKSFDFTHDRIKMAPWTKHVYKHDVVMVVPNSQISMSEPAYAPTAIKNMTKLWYTASNMTSQNELGLYARPNRLCGKKQTEKIIIFILKSFVWKMTLSPWCATYISV